MRVWGRCDIVYHPGLYPPILNSGHPVRSLGPSHFDSLAALACLTPCLSLICWSLSAALLCCSATSRPCGAKQASVYITRLSCRHQTYIIPSSPPSPHQTTSNMGSPTEVTYNDNEKHLGQTADVDEKDATNVNVLPAGSSESSVVEGAELGHVPRSRKFNIKRFFRSLVTKEAWFGDYVSTLPSCDRLYMILVLTAL